MQLSPKDIQTEKTIRSKERWIFFKRWLKSPKQMGTLAPIGQNLALAASNFIKPGKVIELGAGTGRLSRVLCKLIDDKDFAALELDSEFCSFLKETLPSNTHVIEGDARNLSYLLPKQWDKKADTIVSVLPLMYMPKSLRDEIIDEALSCLSSNGVLIHITYNPWSPILHRYDIEQTKLKTCFKNIPPGHIWKFRRAIQVKTDLEPSIL